MGQLRLVALSANALAQALDRLGRSRGDQAPAQTPSVLEARQEHACARTDYSPKESAQVGGNLNRPGLFRHQLLGDPTYSEWPGPMCPGRHLPSIPRGQRREGLLFF